MKDGCGVATRYERCGGSFLNAVILAAIIISACETYTCIAKHNHTRPVS